MQLFERGELSQALEIASPLQKLKIFIEVENYAAANSLELDLQNQSME